MKKYSNPKMEIKTFISECVVTGSSDTKDGLQTWKQDKNGKIVERNYQAMQDVTQLVF